MKMERNNLYIALAFAVSLFFFIFAAACQDAQAETDADEEMKFDEGMAAVEMGGSVQGDVVKVDPRSKMLVIRDAQYEEGLVTIVINSDTTYVGTASLDTIKPGDSVSIDTISIGDARIADTIIMEEEYIAEGSQPVLEKVLVD